MKKQLLFFAFCFFSFGFIAQNNWKWIEITSLPVAVTNNAISHAFISGKKYVYSFGGVTDSLNIDNISQRVFKYEVNTDFWEEVASIPDSLGKIESRVSFVNGKIYLIGGKYILQDGTTITSNKVHHFNPFLDTFEVNASPIPIPVSNQVQSVWRDSLIFVISGENEMGFVPEVQIYNPYFDAWSSGTTLPDADEYKSFGTSGFILEDTIYYYGGSSNAIETSTSRYLRKGVIDKDNPSDISWTSIFLNSDAEIYGGVCSGHNQTLFWLGGTLSPYVIDFVGGNTLTTPNNLLLEYQVKNKNNIADYDIDYNFADLNGIAKLGGGNWVVAGGLDSLNQISSRVFLFHNAELTDFEKAQQPPFFQINEMEDYYIIVTENIGKVSVYDMVGRLIYSKDKHLADLKIYKGRLDNGVLLFVYEDGTNLPVFLKKLNLY